MEVFVPLLESAHVLLGGQEVHAMKVIMRAWILHGYCMYNHYCIVTGVVCIAYIYI